jgi:hypothetical protein
MTITDKGLFIGSKPGKYLIYKRHEKVKTRHCFEWNLYILTK